MNHNGETHNGNGDWLAARFEADRTHLKAVAYRMLGSTSEAEDAVQEAWIRLSRSDTSDVDNLTGWLTTVVARVCLDMLRSRRSRREEPEETFVSESDVVSLDADDDIDPAEHAVLADSVGMAMLVVLETLAPAERVAFVLHDMFAVPFEQIASILGRSPTAARQLASRARRRVQGAQTVPDADFTRRREIVDAFIAASRGGGFDALLAVLDPDVVGRADAAAAAMGGVTEQRGAREIATIFLNRARALRVAMSHGVPMLVAAPGGRPRIAFEFTIENDRVVELEVVADPERLEAMELVLIDA